MNLHKISSLLKVVLLYQSVLGGLLIGLKAKIVGSVGVYPIILNTVIRYLLFFINILFITAIVTYCLQGL